MKYKYYAVINILYELNINSNSLIVNLSESDKRKILRLIKKLKTNIIAENDFIDEEYITFDLYLNDFTNIKIVKNKLYVYRNNILELLSDEGNLVREIILDKALKRNYDDIRKVMQLLYTPKLKRNRRNKMLNSKHR